jgi:hypothetical protein
MQQSHTTITCNNRIQQSHAAITITAEVQPFVTLPQAEVAYAAGEEAKHILSVAIDSHVRTFVQQLKQADDALLGGECEGIAALLQAQLQRAVAATESPPSSALPCHPSTDSAKSLAAAYMTSEVKALQPVAQFMPVDKEQFRLCVQQVLPPLGHIRAHDPSVFHEPHRRDVPLPLPHFDFSQFASSLPADDSGCGDEAPCRVRGGNVVRGRKLDGKGGAGMTQQQTLRDVFAAPAASHGTVAPCNAPSFGNTPSFSTAGNIDVTPAFGAAAAASSLGPSPSSVVRPQNMLRNRDCAPFVAAQARPSAVSSALAAFRSEMEPPSAPGAFGFPVAFAGSSAAPASRNTSLLGSSATVLPPPHPNHLPPPPPHFGVASALEQHGELQRGSAPLLQPGGATDAVQPQLSVLKKMGKYVPALLRSVYYDTLHLFAPPFVLVRCIYFV